MQHVLFICSKNRWRSPTAEHIFATRPGLECASAGLANDADNPLTPELLAWADLIFVMEKAHKTKLQTRFKTHLAHKRIICLGIADKFKYMDPLLITLLENKVGPFLQE